MTLQTLPTGVLAGDRADANPGGRPRLSLSRDRVRVVLLENVNESAATLFREAGYTNVTRLTKALDDADLAEALRGTHILGIRSRTELTREVFEAAHRLMAVGCFSVGTNQVDLDAAREIGVPVFNAPFASTRSVAELVIGEIVMLMRRVLPRSNAAHAGGWDKSATDSHELRGKVLGIVGYGNIGTQLSNLAEAMGMRVLSFDVADKLAHGNAEAVGSLRELLGRSDVVSLHVPETPETANMIGEAEFDAMRPGSYFINNSRGTVVDVDALAATLASGHLRGAAVDVFPVEPGSNAERFVSPLQGLPNVLLTPHIGASTMEAQERIGEEVARKLIAYSDTGSTAGAVNFPQVQLIPRPNGTRFIHVHRNLPGMLRGINEAFSSRGINVSAQFLQTDGDLGYVVVEADPSADADAILDELRAIDGTLRARLVY